MKITDIHTYGTMVFNQDGGVTLDGWSVSTDPACERHASADGSVSTWAPSGSDALADDWFVLD